MFTHAEFNRGGRALCGAFVTVSGYPGLHRATLWRFTSGDTAWWVRGVCIAWPHRVRIDNRIGNTPEVWRHGYGHNRSPLPE